jgi:cytochrome c556
MRLHTPVIVGGIAVLALAVTLLSAHADENESKAPVLKLAELIENGDDTKAATKGLAKFDLNEAMGLLKLRSREGLGLGPRGGAYPAKEDGIEAKIMALASKELPAAQLKTQAADLEKAAYVVAALAHVSEAHTPARKVGAKDPKDWAKFTEEMKRGSMGLAAAVKKGSPAEVKKVASKLNASCNACHEIFRN